MDFKTAVRTCLKSRYSDFAGRASRSEFWYFYLFLVLVNFAFYICEALFGSTILIWLFLVAYLAFIVYAFIPWLAASVRRLHDINLNGWWLLLLLIPLGQFVVFIMDCLPGTAGPNRFGPNPLIANTPRIDLDKG